jgi:formylglycine-generating enzyme required for sulfatase activity
MGVYSNQTMPTPPHPDIIPNQLLANIEKGHCVLFLGADCSLGPGSVSSRPELAQHLKQLYLDLEATTGLEQAAETFLALQPANRHALVSFLQEHATSQSGVEFYRHLADLDIFSAVVSTWYDNLLEQTYRQKGKKVACVVSGLDSAYTSSGEDLLLVKLYGSLERPESLVITESDQMDVESDLAKKLEDVRPYVRLRPIVFLGWSPAERSLKQLYIAATRALGEHKRKNYIVWPEAVSQVNLAWWQRQNVEILQVAPLDFILELKRQLADKSVSPSLESQRLHHTPITRLPYKFLDFYTRQDEDIFYGRQIESVRFFRLALSHPVSVLFGASGTGKSSLLNAGVAPLLEKEQYSVLYVRALDEPLAAIRAEALDWRKRQGRQVKDPGPIPLHSFFQAILEPQEKLVVVLDQFEEFFLRLGDPLRQRFWLELAAFREPSVQPTETHQDGAEVRFVLSLREDYFHQMDEARRYLPDILSDSYRLTSLSEDKASTVITEPAARAGVTTEPALAERLLADLGEAGAIAPPQLQIVCFHLFLDCLSNPDEALRGAPIMLKRTLIRLADYQRLGEAKGILADYVRDELNRLDDSSKRDLARALLKVLVTSEATKAAQNRAEIERGLAEAGALDTQNALGLAQAHDVLCLLVERRLLREFERGGQALYELAHDHLAKEIHTWIDQAELQTKLARELLRREMETWHSAGLLIGRDALAIIHECRGTIRQIDVDALELLLRSSLAVGYETPYWFERAGQGGVQVNDIVLEGLKAENFRTRAAAVQALAPLAQAFEVLQTSKALGMLCNMLADLYPQVRVASIAVLEKLQPTGDWRKHLKYECYVPAGEFIMGNDKSGRDDEMPAHKVFLDAYYIAKYPVTNAEYQRYRQDIQQPFTLSEGKENHPVVEVSWYDARDYAAWAGMRLLSEAQWEKAALWQSENRASESVSSRLFFRIQGKAAVEGKKWEYPWGDIFDTNKCNTRESATRSTTPVGKYSPQGDSPYGVADMAGNVWEWLNDWYSTDYYKNSPPTNPTGPKNGGSKVLRGGSWYSFSSVARCAYRSSYDPDLRNDLHGFRAGWLPENH